MRGNSVEEVLEPMHGWVILLIILGLSALGVFFLLNGIQGDRLSLSLSGIFLVFLSFFSAKGFFAIEPNTAIICTFLGDYTGTIKDSGFGWVNPFFSKKMISTKFHNFNTNILKVNDEIGSPIEIGAVITWKVEDTAAAIFNVEEYEHFVQIKCETGVRELASKFPYSVEDEKSFSLSKNKEHISKILKEMVQGNVNIGGISIYDAQISHLAYAPEIAQSMLKKQQALALLDARKMMVKGVFSIIEESSKDFGKVADFSKEQKVTLVTNLLTVLLSDNNVHPVISMSQN